MPLSQFILYKLLLQFFLYYLSLTDAGFVTLQKQSILSQIKLDFLIIPLWYAYTMVNTTFRVAAHAIQIVISHDTN